jgi:hypothetical protein
MSSDNKVVNPKKKSTKPVSATQRNPRILIYTIATIAVLLIALAVPYFMWYQNPNKVVADGVLNAISSKSNKISGDVNFTNEKIKLTATIDSQTAPTSAMLSVKLALEDKEAKKTTNIVADGILDDNGDLYVKVDDSKQILAAITDAAVASLQSKQQAANASPEAIAGYRAMVTEIYKPISKSVDGQWIKIPANTVNPFSGQASSVQKCLSETLKLAADDNKVADEVTKIYKDHEFISVDDSLGSNGSDVGYKVTINQQKAKEFVSAVDNTEVGKKVNSCIKGMVPSDKKKNDITSLEAKDLSVELWINRWNHEIKRVKTVANNGDASFDIATDFNAHVNIESPKEVKTLQDVIDSLAGAK